MAFFDQIDSGSGDSHRGIGFLTKQELFQNESKVLVIENISLKHNFEKSKNFEGNFNAHSSKRDHLEMKVYATDFRIIFDQT